MNIDELKLQVSNISWFHTIELGNEVVTKGLKDTPKILERIQMPNDLKGKTVLDIGAWDGFYSFESERRGADRVLATDSYCWSGKGWGTKAGFQLAHKALSSRVEDLEIEVLDISQDKIGSFDLVLFLGVLYHMKHPLLALEKVFNVTKSQLILETVVDLINMKKPVMAFYPRAELNKDSTNWWAPNPAALVEMLKVVGFSRVKIMRKPQPLPVRICRSIIKFVKQREPMLHQYSRDRVVVHAWK